MIAPMAMLRAQTRGLRASGSTIFRFRKELLAHWPELLLAILCTIGYTGMRLLEPWPLKVIMDNVISAHPFSLGIPWVDAHLNGERTRLLAAASAALLVFALLRGVFYYAQSVLTSLVGQEVVIRIRRQLYAHLQRLGIDFHHRSSTGDLLTRLTGDINNLRQLLAASLLSMISETILLLAFLGVMIWMNWRLALLAVVVMPAISGIVAFYSARIRTQTRKQRRREGELASRMHEILSGIHVVKMFTREGYEDERLRTLNRKSLRAGVQSTRLEARMNQGIEVSVAIGMALTLWFGANEVIAGRLTAGGLLVFITYMQSFYRPIRRLSRVAERASKVSSCVDRITEVLDQEPNVVDGWRQAGRFRGHIEFDHVTFGYDGRTPIVRDVDLEMHPGRTLAVVGPSGAGKSTLLSLLPRMYDVTDGRILIDGTDIRNVTLQSLRENIAIVPQDGVIFAGTVAENIRYGKLDATDDEVIAAATSANLHDVIMDLPEGYDTHIAERGTSLSGGQRQRVAIARAIVRDAPIVLLDEPTTGLDAKSEHLVMGALERLLAGRTAIVIAHRLKTVEQADAIAYFDDGTIQDLGTHADLLERCAGYREFQHLARAETTPIALRDAGAKRESA
jgi:ABC-type multidrug transport system fused ATPase/permease subunit